MVNQIKLVWYYKHGKNLYESDQPLILLAGIFKTKLKLISEHQFNKKKYTKKYVVFTYFGKELVYSEDFKSNNYNCYLISITNEFKLLVTKRVYYNTSTQLIKYIEDNIAYWLKPYCNNEMDFLYHFQPIMRKLHGGFINWP